LHLHAARGCIGIPCTIASASRAQLHPTSLGRRISSITIPLARTFPKGLMALHRVSFAKGLKVI